MDLDELERLAALVQGANISEITLKQGNARVTLRKSGRVGISVSTALVPFQEDYLNETGTMFPDDEDMAEADSSAAEPTLMIQSPLVGVFGHVKPLIGLGAKVKEGQVVGVIEAMKLISEVKAPAAGIISDVLIEDGLAVEYGQPLFEIRLES